MRKTIIICDSCKTECEMEGSSHNRPDGWTEVKSSEKIPRTGEYVRFEACSVECVVVLLKRYEPLHVVQFQ